MSRFIIQAPTLRELALVYRRMLAFSALVALAACEGATDSLAPDVAGAPEIAAASSPGLPALTTNRIAFASNTAGGYSDIWTVSPQAGTPTRLTSFTGQEHSPSWSFDHTRIAFARTRNGLLDIQLMKADGTGKHWARSMTFPGLIDQPSWSPDGSHLLVRVSSQGITLAKLDLATGNSRWWRRRQPSRSRAATPSTTRPGSTSITATMPPTKRSSALSPAGRRRPY